MIKKLIILTAMLVTASAVPTLATEQDEKIAELEKRIEALENAVFGKTESEEQTSSAKGFEYAKGNIFFIDANEALYRECMEQQDYQRLKSLCKNYIDANDPPIEDYIMQISSALQSFDFSQIAVDYDEFDNASMAYYPGYNETTDSVHVFITYNRDNNRPTGLVLNFGFIQNDGWFFANEVKLKKFGDNDYDSVWCRHVDFSREVISGSTVKEWYRYGLSSSDIDYIANLSPDDRVGVRFVNGDGKILDFDLSQENITALLTMIDYCNTVMKANGIFIEACHAVGK